MLVPDLPHDLDSLVMQLLEKDPAHRPADGFVLLRQLERVKAKLDRKQAHETIIPSPFVTLKPESSRSGRRSDVPTITGEGPAALSPPGSCGRN